LLAEQPKDSHALSSDGHGNTLITVDANDVVTLSGVAPGSLHAADFHIV